MHKKVKIGIVGTGMISNVIAQSINESENAELVTVASRTSEAGKQFAETHGIDKVFDDRDQMMKWEGVDAVYIGVPTIAKEEIAVKRHKME